MLSKDRLILKFVQYSEFKYLNCIYSVILFVILASYHFLHISENVLIKIGKINTKIHEIGKIKAIFGLGLTPI